MIDSQVIAFFFVASVLAITPGADTLLVMKNSMRFGSAAGWATTFGILGGTLMHALISALGISVILAQSETLFQLVKAFGALYLVWLGIQALRCSGHAPPDAPSGKHTAVRGAFLEGLITNILNPKVAIFYIAFLPQFIDASDPVLAKSLLLASIHNGLSLLWLGALVTIIARGSTWMQRPHIQKRLSHISGAILIALGLRLALESR